MGEYIERNEFENLISDTDWYSINKNGELVLGASSRDTALFKAGDIFKAICEQPAADVVEVDKVAEMLRLMFDDDCACNYNNIDEWLPEKCKYAETDCPTPKERLGCWKEFVRAFLAKMDEEQCMSC